MPVNIDIELQTSTPLESCPNEAHGTTHFRGQGCRKNILLSSSSLLNLTNHSVFTRRGFSDSSPMHDFTVTLKSALPCTQFTEWSVFWRQMCCLTLDSSTVTNQAPSDRQHRVDRTWCRPAVRFSHIRAVRGDSNICNTAIWVGFGVPVMASSAAQQKKLCLSTSGKLLSHWEFWEAPPFD